MMNYNDLSHRLQTSNTNRKIVSTNCIRDVNDSTQEHIILNAVQHKVEVIL